MQNDSSSDGQIPDQNDKRNPENHKIDEIKEEKENFDEIFEQKIIQNINPTFQTVNSLNQRSSQMMTQQIEKIASLQVRSIFHNFQKHLVITIRKNIRIKKSSSKNQFQSVAWQIWQNFISQPRVYTKNILHVLFGVVDYEGSDLRNIYDEGIVQKFGYGEIFERYTEELIMAAQGFLRFQVIKQIKRMDLEEVMKKRRLVNRDEFIEYVKEFIGELQEGPMRKRLPKNKKAEMKLEKISQNK